MEPTVRISMATARQLLAQAAAHVGPEAAVDLEVAIALATWTEPIATRTLAYYAEKTAALAPHELATLDQAQEAVAARLAQLQVLIAEPTDVIALLGATVLVSEHAHRQAQRGLYSPENVVGACAASQTIALAIAACANTPEVTP